MASLQQLLAEEGFERGHGHFMKKAKPVMLKDRTATDHESIALPIHICHDLKTFDFSKQKAVSRKGHSVNSSKRESSDSKSLRIDGIGREEPAIDEVAIRAVISILSGYSGRYLKEEIFRESIREKFNSCLEKRRKKESDNGFLENLELGVESIDKLVEAKGTNKELRMKLLRNSIQLLSIVSSLNSKKTKHSSTCGIPNSHLSAFAQLYLSIIYKVEKNDRISARHLLQVFCDSPYLTRTHLLPDLWEHFFLPHLLHLKVWYHKEIEFLSNLDYGEKEKRMEALSKIYNDQMDMGTTQFALYYKTWLKIGAKAPAVPSVPLPSRTSYGLSRRRSSDSYTSNSSLNKNLFRTVFGPTERKSLDLDNLNSASNNAWSLKEDHEVSARTDNYNNFNYVHNSRNQKSELWLERQKSDYFRFFTCQSVPAEEYLVNGNHLRHNSSRNEDKVSLHSSVLSRAITTICSSDNLSECEIAIQVIVKTWLNSHGDPAIEAELSKAPIIEGMLEVLFGSNDDEILELAISILAEIVAKNELNRQIVLNFDPQLEIFIKLLRSTSLFLKASVLLYLLKPKAKQMISTEWVPLVLRVLEFGDQFQTLFTVCCSAQVAAFYFLEQLLNGFDEGKNFENAREVVSHGGLALLVGRIEKGEINERQNTASIILCCIQADENCRSYLAENLNKASLLELIVLENRNSNGCAIALLTELLCLTRRTQMMKFLDGLNNGWGGLNTMHIFLVYLQRASEEERPLVAAILLQLDLLRDPSNCSMYREEAVDAITAALDGQTCSEKIQEQSARALLMLGGHFSSYTEEATSEKWLLKLAGFSEHSDDSFYSKYENLNDEGEATEIWQRKAALALLKSGNKSFLAGLANCIANGIPSLARASLFTVAWISRFLHSAGDENFLCMACSILMPPLLEASSYDRALEERTLASLSLERLAKTSVSTLDKELIGPLQNHGDRNISIFTGNLKLQ